MEAVKHLYVVTPVMNGVETIAQTIDSVLSQEGDFVLHYHIQDGGSTDGTLEVLQRVEAELPDRSPDLPTLKFSYAVEADTSVYDAISKGFGRFDIPLESFMTWINSDDLIMPDAFRTVVGIAAGSQGIEWVGGINKLIRDKETVLSSNFIPYPQKIVSKGLCDGVYWSHMQQEGLFWKKSLWDRAGGLRTDLRLAGDWDLWRRFAKFAPLVQIRQPLGAFRRREGQLSGDRTKYLAEVNAVCSDLERRAAMIEIVHDGADNLYYTTVVPGADGPEVASSPVGMALPESSKHYFVGGVEEVAKYADADSAAQEPVAMGDTETSDVIRYTPRGRLLKDGVKPDSQLWRDRLSVYWDIFRSGLFFPTYYAMHNPDVCSRKRNLLWHYVCFGDSEQRKPNPLFDPGWYRLRNPDVQRVNGMNALWHYIKYGRFEGRASDPKFSGNGYLAKNKDVRESGMDPLVHYLYHGVHEFRKI